MLEVSTRLKSSIILTFSVGLSNIRDVKERVTEIKARSRGIEWHEFRALSHENLGKGVPSFIGRFMRSSGIAIPINFKKVVRLLKGKIVYLIIVDAYQAVFLAIIAMISGAHRIILGLHARPGYRRFIHVKPILLFMNKVGLLKGIHTVNIVDALTLRGILGKITIWWIPNGVDCKKFKPGIKRNDKFQVLFIGALSEDKGIDTFIETARIVKNKYDDVHFSIASVGGPLKSVVEEACKEGVVEFLGFVSDNELRQLYAESHIAVFPSREEAFGLISLEAQASGTPVIATDLPAFKQSVINGVTGILVKPYSSQAFANAIIKVRDMWLNHRQKYVQISEAATKNAERFCWEKVVKIYESLFLK